MKLVAFEVSSNGKEVSELQVCHALPKFVPSEVSISGKEVRDEQDRHALLKFTPVAAVPSFAPAGNDVSAVQFCHADTKFEQFLISVVLKSLSEVLPSHAESTRVASGNSLSKLIRAVHEWKALRREVAVGNGVLNEVRPLDSHALLKFTALLTAVPSFASCGNDVSDEQSCQQPVKSVPFLMSVVLKSLSCVQL